MRNQYIIKKRAIICPVCQGKGKYQGKTCPECGGEGWIVIDEDYWEQSCWYLDGYYPIWYPCWDSSTQHH